MERALELATLGLALGDHESLPSPVELQRLIADTETGLFIQRGEIPSRLISTAWYLHGIASVPEALALYERDRQLRAFQVSAHVFDLALTDVRRPVSERMRLAFGAQVGYRRSGLEPNAMAMYLRMREHIGSDRTLLEHISRLSLEAGVALLGFRPRVLFPLFGSWLRELDALQDQLGVDIHETPFGIAASVVEGCNHLLRFLTLGDAADRQRAIDVLSRAAAEHEFEVDDTDSRWVAAHLRHIAEGAAEAAVWSALPPSVPPAARRSLTLTSPPVLTLWEPQARLLSGRAGSNPLDPDVRRAVLAVPTSAGKTLTAQILMVDHLATEIGTVCFVAPMRSLAREVRTAMRGRLRMLRRELGRDLPDYADWGIEQADLDPVGVEVMTPERLMQLLRRDATEVLARFTMFIFDEAHMLAESGRGPLLEQLISFIHWKTLDTHHRVILLSAALGNKGEIMSWLDPSGQGAPYSSDWRGPRRLHAIYSTQRDDSRFEQQTVSRAQNEYTVRKVYPLQGVIRLKPADGMRETRLQFVEPIGQIAHRETPSGRRQSGVEKAHTTRGYETSAHIAAAVGHGGPVLVVMSSRVMARQMARAIRGLLDRRSGTRALTTLVRDHLGPDHPLVEVLPFGVAYHHGGLPTDVLEALEEGLRQNVLGWMVATSTLTEGVNLPVRTVVIAETRYDDQPVEAQLRGARLVNAMGRAGRATQESEGWVVLCLNARPEPADFAKLRPTDAELRVQSQLASPEALTELASFENDARTAEDAVFRFAGEHVRGFVAFVWFVLASEDASTADEVVHTVDAALSHLFGFRQLTSDQQRRWRTVALATGAAYTGTDPVRRSAWAQTGTSIRTARELDRHAESLAMAVLAAPSGIDVSDPYAALHLVDEAGFLEATFEFHESPHSWGFRSHRNAPRKDYVDPLTLAVEWLGGTTLPALANEHLQAVTKLDERVEQMVDTVTELFEHFLSWMLGILVDAVNRRLKEAASDRQLCPDLSLFMRYGVDRPIGVTLATGGVRSRRVLHAIGNAAEDAGRVATVEDWLSEMSIADWRQRFRASTVDILDLLDLTRAKSGALLPDLLETGRAALEIDLNAQPRDGAVAAKIAPLATDPSPQRLGVFGLDGQTLGFISPREHGSVAAILDTGLPLAVELDGALLTIELSDADAVV